MTRDEISIRIPKFDPIRFWDSRVTSATLQKRRNESSCNSDGPDGSKDPAQQASKRGKKVLAKAKALNFVNKNKDIVKSRRLAWLVNNGHVPRYDDQMLKDKILKLMKWVPGDLYMQTSDWRKYELDFAKVFDMEKFSGTDEGPYGQLLRCVAIQKRIYSTRESITTVLDRVVPSTMAKLRDFVALDERERFLPQGSREDHWVQEFIKNTFKAGAATLFPKHATFGNVLDEMRALARYRA